MCSPKAPDTSAQQAEASREAQVQEQEYQQQLASQQSEWEKEFQDSQTRYQTQLQSQQDEINRQLQMQQDAQTKAESDRQAQIAQQQQTATLGRAYSNERGQLIDNAIGDANTAYSGFNDAYFNKFASDFVTANRGQLDYDHDTDTRKMRYKLADNMNLNSSAAADAFGDIDKQRDIRLQQLSGQASNQSNALRSQINGQKGNAINSLYALGNTPTPDFMNSDDEMSAIQRFGSSLDGISNNVRSGAQSYRAAF